MEGRQFEAVERCTGLLAEALIANAVNDLMPHCIYIKDSGITECFQPGVGCLKESRHHEVASYPKPRGCV